MYVHYLGQAKKSQNQLEEQMSELRSIVETAEDRVFDAFCRRLKLNNIREYEGRQLTWADEEQSKKVKFQAQIARLNNA